MGFCSMATFDGPLKTTACILKDYERSYGFVQGVLEGLMTLQLRCKSHFKSQVNNYNYA